MRLALDAMGGDNAPREPVLGAVQAIQAYPEVEIILVGDEDEVRRTLADVPFALGRRGLTIHHAPERIDMGESPVTALRNKPNNSISAAVALVADGKADAAISAGSTGAFVAAATLGLSALPGVRRPGIAVMLPSVTGCTSLIDVGANVQCKPINLFQYAVMATIYHRYVVGVEKPTVGLLNVGSEARKGTPFTKEVHAMLAASSLDFVGNVEGEDLFNGKCDVAVCDGFVGNVVLKASEGMAEMILHTLHESRERDAWSRLGLNLLRPVLKEIADRCDFAEYGGAPLLGVEGECIICHGRSHARAFVSAVRAAISFHQHHVNEQIVAAVAAEPAPLPQGQEVRGGE